MSKFLLHFKNHFVPHSGNDHKPHLFRNQSILVILIIVLLAEATFLFQILFTFNKTNLLASVLPAVLTSITNEDRVANKVLPLVENNLLDQAAKMKAEDMASRGYFSHTTPDGKNPWYWLDQVGYKYSYAGENLAVNFFESKDVAEAWMNSPTHRANIVKKEFTEVGTGVANGIYEGKATVFVAQFFGTPAGVVSKATFSKDSRKSITPEVNKSNNKINSIATKVLGESTTKSETFSFWDEISISPRTYLDYLYIALSFLIAFTTFLILILKSRKKHPFLFLRGLAVLALVIAFSLINKNIFTNETKVPTENTANSIGSVSK